MQRGALSRCVFAGVTALILLTLAGCGGGGSTKPVSTPEISVTISSTGAFLEGGGTQTLTAKVANDPFNAGVTWSIPSGGGSLGAVTVTGANYTAPLPATTGAAVVTATSTTDPTKSASITIPLVATSVDVSPANVSLSDGGSQVFTATAANDFSTAGVSWSLDAGQGKLSNPSTTGVTYTAPQTVSGISPVSITLTATSIADPARSAAASITLTSLNAPPSQWVYYQSGNLVYQPFPNFDNDGSDGYDQIMDFSTAGYEQGAAAIPTAPVEATVAPSGADDTPNIQAAINAVSGMPLDATTGLRGAVLLEPGSYTVKGSLTITVSGVVLRGSGSGVSPGSNTVITMAPATKPYPLFVLGTKGKAPNYNPPIPVGSPTAITNSYVPAGTLTVDVVSTTGLQVGTPVLITKPVTEDWVNHMGMTPAELGNDCPPTSSTPCDWIDVGSVALVTDRTITAIDGNQLTLDAPMSDSIDSTYCGVNGATLQAYKFDGRISQVGVENLRAVAPVPATDLKPPVASYQLVVTYSVLNAWARNLTAQDTLQSIDIESYSKQVTVSNVSITHTVTQTDNAMFEEFYIQGATQVMMDTVSDVADETLFFATSATTQGPNVLRNGTFAGNAKIEPHQRWATGLLVEDTTVTAISGSTQGDINLWDRGNYGSGHGWAIGWGVVWNATAYEFTIQEPPGSENWCIGCVGEQLTKKAPGGSKVLAQGAIDSSGTYVFPYSLYQAQLTQRLGAAAVPQ